MRKGKSLLSKYITLKQAYRALEAYCDYLASRTPDVDLWPELKEPNATTQPNEGVAVLGH